jgi:hypothetical protein
LKPSLLCVFSVAATLVGFSSAPPAAAPPAASSAKPVSFNRDVLPILSDNCFACHGPDEKQRMANLRLDEKESIFADRGGYHVVVPGRSAESKLFQKISATDVAVRMPPVYANRTLTPAQIELIRRWIDEGASYSKHWAFVAPKRPPVPAVKEKAWPRNPIDNFILARLQSEGLKPSPEASRTTLLRRVTFDLTGLPPTPAEVDSFLADRSPNAYERRVDQLLASPHYGERMARGWLDLARYADSHGIGSDTLREMWPWRDWVIRAYNQNLPYDQFTIKQIAGDLLPNATRDDKLATGFNRNHMINSDMLPPEQYRVEYVVDRVSTSGTTWLGLTVGCARCHDHKYDPFKQKDFYRLFAFFNTIPELGRAHYVTNADPVLSLPSPEQKQRLDELESQIASTLAQLPENEVAEEENRWRQTRLPSMPEPPKDGLTAYYEFEGKLTDSSGHGEDAKAVAGEVRYTDGSVGKAAEFDETEVSFAKAGDFDRDYAFALALWVSPGSRKAQEVLQKRDGSANWKGYEVSLDDPISPGGEETKFRIWIRLASHWPDDAIEVKSKSQTLTRSPMQHLTVNYDGSGKASGVTVYLDGKPLEMETVKDHLTGSFGTSAPLVIGNKSIGRPFRGLIDDLRIYCRALPPGEVENLAVQLPVRSLLAELAGQPVKEIPSIEPEKPPVEVEKEPEQDKILTETEKEAERLQKEQEQLNEYFLKSEAPEPYRQAYARLKALKAEREKLKESIPSAMVMAEMKKARQTFVLGRGQYDNPQEKVTPGMPAFLLPWPENAPGNRLGLARWLVDPGNPLTARVEVNRYWQSYFGTGIVKTAENFGLQGDPPSHPELLDWLATEFVRTGWNVKAMQRLIVTSAAYRQSSRVTPQIEERDPENRLLARGPRVRLPAEEIRDSALAVSGLLNDKIGGPSVYPYQPDGLWEEVSPREDLPGQTYKQSVGPDLYRRSLYTVWKRTVPPPSLLAFDAPSRERCTARRMVTSTPLQALVLLNDPTYVEASRALAQRAILEAGRSPVQRIDFAFRLATQRKPNPTEQKLLLQFAQYELAHYRQDGASASKLVNVGEVKRDPRVDPTELAAWTAVARIILNMDETITKQ